MESAQTPQSNPPGAETDATENDAAHFGEIARLVTDSTPLLLSYIDASLRYRFVNQAYVDWFGGTVGDIVGKTAEELIGPSAFANVSPYLYAALAGNRVRYEGSMPYPGLGQRYVFIDLVPDRDEKTGDVRGFVAVVADITDRRETEETLANRERYLAALLDNSPDIISRWGPDLRCQFTSLAAARTLNVPTDFFLGKTHDEMGMPSEFANETDANLRRVFDTGQVVPMTFTLSTVHGPRFYEASCAPVFDERHSVEAVMMVSRDVTERRAAEAERAALLLSIAEAAQAQRQFLRDVLFSVSEGKFILCKNESELPAHLPLVGMPVPLPGQRDLKALRRAVYSAVCDRDFAEERAQDLITASGEAAMNAVVHGGGGEACVCARPHGDVVQVWITDRGKGIGMDFLHKATLERGFTTAGTLGHGFWLMMKTADRLHLLTGENGTTLVLEQEKTEPLPSWLQAAEGLDLAPLPPNNGEF